MSPALPAPMGPADAHAAPSLGMRRLRMPVAPARFRPIMKGHARRIRGMRLPGILAGRNWRCRRGFGLRLLRSGARRRFPGRGARWRRLGRGHHIGGIDLMGRAGRRGELAAVIRARRRRRFRRRAPGCGLCCLRRLGFGRLRFDDLGLGLGRRRLRLASHTGTPPLQGGTRTVGHPEGLPNRAAGIEVSRIGRALAGRQEWS